MTNVEEILERFGLHPPKAAVGRYYTTCPKCSAARSRANQKRECLGITIDDKGVQFGCNHCDFKGGALYKPNGAARDPFVATYDYYDEGGKLLFQVCRTADKQFPQRRPDGNGGWIWGTKGVRKVLYHLNEVTEAIANDHPILVVEGEKDVLSLQRIGIAATCNPGGASEPGKKPKWTKEYSETLRGADIIVIPDHDPAGYAHAESICRMSAATAKSVRILKLAGTWPACPKGGDVSDWLAAGHTREQLDELIEREAKTESAQAGRDTAPPPPTSEDSIALLFAERHGHEVRYVAMWSRWLSYDGTRWANDETLHAFDRARVICREITVASAKTVAAVERLAKADRRLAATAAQWDANCWMFNTEEDN
jgi:putative DNA primase/helicase